MDDACAAGADEEGSNEDNSDAAGAAEGGSNAAGAAARGSIAAGAAADAASLAGAASVPSARPSGTGALEARCGSGAKASGEDGDGKGEDGEGEDCDCEGEDGGVEGRGGADRITVASSSATFIGGALRISSGPSKGGDGRTGARGETGEPPSATGDPDGLTSG